jgi:hypothetical protein
MFGLANRDTCNNPAATNAHSIAAEPVLRVAVHLHPTTAQHDDQRLGMHSNDPTLTSVPERPGPHARLPTKLVSAAAARIFSKKQSFWQQLGQAFQ